MRNSSKILGSLLVLSLFVLGGCGGDGNKNSTGGSGGSGGDGGSGGNGSSSDVDKFAVQYVATGCAKSVECFTAETEAECIASSSAGFEQMAPYVANGTVIFHSDKAEACLASRGTFNGCSWGEVLPLLADGGDSVKYVCAIVFEGTVKDGGDCVISQQCVSYSCEQVDPNCTDACCPSKCVGSMPPPGPVPPAKIGESCVMGPCEASAYCQTDPSTGAPTTCAAKLAAGIACTQLDSCATPNLCAVNLMTGMGTCQIPPKAGETCDPMAGPFACDLIHNNCDMTTKKCTASALVGATCANSGDCVGYAYCDMATSKCVKRPLEGQACDMMTAPCLGTLQCLDTGKCGFGTAICK